MYVAWCKDCLAAYSILNILHVYTALHAVHVWHRTIRLCMKINGILFIRSPTGTLFLSCYFSSLCSSLSHFLSSLQAHVFCCCCCFLFFPFSWDTPNVIHLTLRYTSLSSGRTKCTGWRWNQTDRRWLAKMCSLENPPHWHFIIIIWSNFAYSIYMRILWPVWH